MIVCFPSSGPNLGSRPVRGRPRWGRGPNGQTQNEPESKRVLGRWLQVGAVEPRDPYHEEGVARGARRRRTAVLVGGGTERADVERRLGEEAEVASGGDPDADPEDGFGRGVRAGA